MTPLPSVRAGQGPPLLLLPAIGSSKRDWATLQPRLAAEFDTLAVDLPGQGEAPPLPRLPTIGHLTDAVEADLTARGLDQVHVVGNSTGGRIALELARRHRALSVVSIAPSGTNLLPERLWQGFGYAVAGVTARVLRPVIGPLSQSALGRTAVLANLRTRGWRATPQEAQAVVDGFGSPDLWRQIVWAALLDVPRPMWSIDCPVTLTQGTNDWIATGQTPRYLALVPGARLRVLPFAGHAPMSDVPDRLVRIVRDTAARAA